MENSFLKSWTKGLTQKSDKSAPQATYQNSFEFLDMSSCDETQKLKLKNTLEMPLLTTAASAPSRDRYRSNFITRSIKPQHYHLNNCVKTQRLNPQSNSSKFSNNLENHESISTRTFCPEGNNFINKINSNFSNQVSTNTNNRNFSNNQDRISKWHNKKPPGKILC